MDPNNPNPRWKEPVLPEPVDPTPPPPPPPVVHPVFGNVDTETTVTYPAHDRPVKTVGPYWQDKVKNAQPGKHVPYDTGLQDQARAQQEAVIQALLRQAQGDKDSIAQQQLRQSTRAGQGQLAGAAAARGNFGGSGAAMRQVRSAQGAMSRESIDSSRLLMLQEQKAAQALLSQLYGTQQGQDLMSALGLSQNELANLGLDDRYMQGMLGLGAADAVSRDRAESDYLLYQTGLDLDRQRAARGELNNFLSAGGSALQTYFNQNNNQPAAKQAPVYNDGVTLDGSDGSLA